MKDFRVLSLKEEGQLSTEELREYYKNLREYLTTRKLTNTTLGATTIAPKLKKITNKICEGVTKKLTTKDVVIECSGTENIPDEPVILAQTHQGILDNFVWIPQISRHCIILHHKDVRKLLIACQLNTGLVLIKKNDRVSSANAKLDIMGLLLRGHSVHWSPEGTYCLSPNKFHLPLRYGVIDVAKKTGAPIIPVAHEFTYENINGKTTITKIQSKYGKPIYVKMEDKLEDKLREYEESISTLKYEMMLENDIYKRSEIDKKEYIEFLKEIYKNIKVGGVDKDYERTQIYGADNDFYQFHHINDIPFDEEGNLLETEEVRKLQLINKKHNI